MTAEEKVKAITEIIEECDKQIEVARQDVPFAEGDNAQTMISKMMTPAVRLAGVSMDAYRRIKAIIEAQ